MTNQESTSFLCPDPTHYSFSNLSMLMAVMFQIEAVPHKMSNMMKAS